MNWKLPLILLLAAGTFAPGFAKSKKKAPARKLVIRDTGPKNHSVGIMLGINPNVNTSQQISTTAFATGENAITTPLIAYGLRGLFDFGYLGAHAILGGLSFGETKDNAAVFNDNTPEITNEKGSGFMAPLSFTLIPVKGEKGKMFVGMGVGYSSLKFEISGTEGTETFSYTIESSTAIWNFVIGAEVYPADRFSLALEYLMARGGNDAADFSGIDTRSSAIAQQRRVAVSHNVDLFMIIAAYRL